MVSNANAETIINTWYNEFKLVHKIASIGGRSLDFKKAKLQPNVYNISHCSTQLWLSWKHHMHDASPNTFTNWQWSINRRSRNYIGWCGLITTKTVRTVGAAAWTIRRAGRKKGPIETCGFLKCRSIYCCARERPTLVTQILRHTCGFLICRLKI